MIFHLNQETVALKDKFAILVVCMEFMHLNLFLERLIQRLDRNWPQPLNKLRTVLQYFRRRASFLFVW